MHDLYLMPALQREVKGALRLAVPLAAAQVAQGATSFADTIMMGLLGRQELAAGGLASNTFAMMLITSTGVISAVSPLVAESFGAGQGDRITRVTQQSLWLAAGLSLPIMLALWHVGGVMQYLGQEPANAALANQYLHAIVWGVVPALGFAALRMVAAALSQPRPVMIIMLCGTGINVVGNYVLMFGKLGLPALGLAGIGWASALSYWVMFLALVGYVLWQPQLRQYRIFHRCYQFSRSLFVELLTVGLPIGALYAVETGLFTVTAYLMGQLGTDTLAAHQMVLQTSAITFMVTVGISYATTVRVGQYRGRDDLDGAQLAGYVGIGLGALFMSAMALLFMLFPRAVVSLYLDVNNPENRRVVVIAIELLQVAGLFQLFDGTQTIAAGALRGLRDTRMPMVIGIFAYWCVGLTSGYLMGMRLGLGGVGLWLGLAVGLAIASVILTWRFHWLISAQLKLQPSETTL